MQDRPRARSLGSVQAVEQAIQVGAPIRYDATAQSPHYNWRDRAEHEVWFEDARFVRAAGAAGEYQLAGVSIWNIMRYFPQLWLVLNSLYDIESWDKLTKPTEFSLFGRFLPYSGSFSLISIAKRLQNPLSYGAWEFPAKSKEVHTHEVQEDHAAGTGACHGIHRLAGAARLPQSGFSFPFRPGYTQTVSRPSASKPLQSTAANSSYAAQVVSLVNAERARQGLPALTVSTTAGRRRRPAPENCKPAFAHTPERRILLYRSDRGRYFPHPCR